MTQTIEKLYIDAEVVSWKITVGYGADAGISADAALEVQEIDGKAHRAEMESLIPEGERLVQARFFVITIIDGGKTVQPAAPVNVCVSLADAPEAARPQAVHFGEAGGELLETTQGEDGVAFDAQSFSDYGIFYYTVEFTEDSYTWSMAGNTSIWLSRLLDALGSDIKISNVADVDSSPEGKLEVTQQDGDWLLALKPLSQQLEQEETLTLTLTLTDNTQRTISIKYRPAEETNLRDYLVEAEFLENGAHVGGSNDPDPMLARVEPHKYQLRLTFEEAGDALQFPENGVDYMRYDLPAGLNLDIIDGYESTFSVLLDKKNTLYGNRVIFHKGGENGSPGWIEIRWNDTPENKKKMKLMNFSPEATFTLNFEVSIPEFVPPKSINFSDTVSVDLDLDTSFAIDLEKTAAMYTNDKEYIRYFVEATAEGNAVNLTLSDVMGEALTFVRENENPPVVMPFDAGADPIDALMPNKANPDRVVRVTYVGPNGEDRSSAYPDTEGVPNATLAPAADGHGVTFTLAKLYDGDKAIISYEAKVDYPKLGGKDHIEETSKNTVTATDSKRRTLALSTIRRSRLRMSALHGMGRRARARPPLRSNTARPRRLYLQCHRQENRYRRAGGQDL